MGDYALARTIISVPKLDLSLACHTTHPFEAAQAASSKTDRYARPGRRLVKKATHHTSREKPVVQQYQQCDPAVDPTFDVGKMIKGRLRNDDIRLLRKIHKQFLPVENKPRNTITHISKDAKQRTDDKRKLTHVLSQPLFIAKRIPLRTDRHAYSLNSKDVNAAAGDFVSVSIDRITTSDLHAHGCPNVSTDLSKNVLAGDSLVVFENFSSMDWFENKAIVGDDDAAGGGGSSSLYNIDDIVNSSTYLSMDFGGKEAHEDFSDFEGADFGCGLGSSALHLEPQPPASLKVEEIAHRAARTFKDTSKTAIRKGKTVSIAPIPEHVPSKYTLKNINDDMLFLNSLIYGSTAHVNLDDISDAASSAKGSSAKGSSSGRRAVSEEGSRVSALLQSQRLLPSKELPQPAAVEPARASSPHRQDCAGQSMPPERALTSALLPSQSQQPKKKAISFATGVGGTPLKADLSWQGPPAGPSHVMSPAATVAPQRGSDSYTAYLQQEDRRKKRLDIVTSYKEELTRRETAELMVHKGEVCFLGDKASKHAFDKRQRNGGYDDDLDYYIATPSDHLYFRYEIVERIHRGSSSAVHRVNDRKSKKVRAVKVYKGGAAFSALAVNEEKMLRILRDDKARGFSGLVSSFEFRGHFCVVMPLYGGPSLSAYLRSHSFQGLSARSCKRALDQLLRCLLYLKQSSIIHCAIRPSNILIKSLEPLEVCLTDFARSKLHNNNSGEEGAIAAPRREHLDASAAHYLAPEVLVEKRPSFGSDVWSLGCTVFEMATGSVLFPASDLAAVATDGDGEAADALVAARQVGCIGRLSDVGAPGSSPDRSLHDYAYLISDRGAEQGAVLGLLQRMLRWDSEERAQAEELSAMWVGTGVVNFVV